MINYVVRMFISNAIKHMWDSSQSFSGELWLVLVQFYGNASTIYQQQNAFDGFDTFYSSIIKQEIASLVSQKEVKMKV